MPVSDAARIAGQGEKITLADGRTLRVRYPMKAMLAIEERWGSINAIQALVGIDEKGAAVGKVFGPLIDLLEIGLAHENLGRDELLDLTDPAQLNSYWEAVGRALHQALPDAGEAAARGNGQGELTTSSSPGPTFTTPPPSPSAGPTPNSGT